MYISLGHTYSAPVSLLFTPSSVLCLSSGEISMQYARRLD